MADKEQEQPDAEAAGVAKESFSNVAQIAVIEATSIGMLCNHAARSIITSATNLVVRQLDQCQTLDDFIKLREGLKR